MLLFTFLIGACVAVRSGVLTPMDKISAVSLIHTAKNDPSALIQMLQGADKDTLDRILGLLDELKNEAIAEQDRLTKLVDSARVNYEGAQAEEKRLTEVELEKKSIWEDADQTFTAADAKYVEAKKIHDEREPHFTKESEVFRKVLAILQNLINEQPQEKELLALGISSQGRVYQKMIENAKADPAKVNRIITIVEKLLSDTEEEFLRIKNEMNTRLGEKNEAETKKNAAFGAWQASLAQLNALKITVSQLKGAFEEAQREYDTHHAGVTAERKTLEEVIKILSEMRESQE